MSTLTVPKPTAQRSASLLKLLVDPAQCTGFKQFLKQNVAEENLQFWFEVETFKTRNHSSQQEMQKEAETIHEKYCSETARYLLNLDVNTISAVRSKVKSGATIDTFNTAQNEIYTLMEMDLLPKFMRTDSFKSTCAPANEMVKENLFMILDALTNFVKAFQNPDKAADVRSMLLSLGVKLSLVLLYPNNAKSNAQYDTVVGELKPILHRLCDKAIDGFEIPFSFNPAELSEIMKEAQQKIHKLFKNVLSDQTLQDIDTIVNFFADEDLLADFFTKRKWKETGELTKALRKLWEEGYV